MAHPETQEAIGETAPSDPIDDILKFIPDDDQPEPAPEEGDDEPEDEGLEPEDLEDEPEEEPAAPAIKPPVSWTAEEQAKFAELPPEMQETITRREAEREKFVQKAATEAKAARVQVQQQAVQELQGIHVQNLAALQAMLPEIPAEPSEYLRLQDPHAYADQAETYKWAVAQHNYVQRLMGEIGQQHTAAQQALAQQQGEYTRSVLSEQFPEFLDPAKAPELKNQLRSTAIALGFPEENLGNLSAIEILAARTATEWKAKAEKFDALQSRKMANVRAARGLPRVAKPGTPAPREQSKAARADAAWQRTKASKSGADFADFLEASGISL